MRHAALTGMGALLGLSCNLRAPGQMVDHAANRVEAYKVRFWGTDESLSQKPTFHVLSARNGPLELRYCIRPGRWGNYTLPYWPITGFLSIVSQPAELALLGDAECSLMGETKREAFAAFEGFELATSGTADILRVTNEGGAGRLLMDYFHVVDKGKPTVQVVARVTNISPDPLEAVRPRALYQQSFNWSDFAAAAGGPYEPVSAPASGEARAFVAYSLGMQRGYEFLSGDGCRLSWHLADELNGWRVALNGPAESLEPGESSFFAYTVRAVRRLPARPARVGGLQAGDVLNASFHTVWPTVFKSSPVRPQGRVMLRDVIQGLARPKPRGLNLRANTPIQALQDLETLRSRGCNLAIIGIGGDPEQTARVIEKGHALGMEMMLQGQGRFTDGPPTFDAYYTRPRPTEQHADSHGQDEDHTYWYAIAPTRDFEADFGKPMALATQEEKVLYWSRCFTDKWRGVLETVRRAAPAGDIWFYDPSPWLCHLEPLDYYDIFFREIAGLNEVLTVLPFYYGVDFDNCEYMVRRWKEAGVARVLFLPMRGFMDRPSQFLRAITAARRGGADGTCGFAFPVGDEEPEQAWQWKSVMLAAEANFPTPELDAYCFMEEPAELLEMVARSDVTVVSDETEAEAFVARLRQLLPGEVELRQGKGPRADAQGACVVIGGPSILGKADWPYDPRKGELGSGKGVVQMRGRTVSVCGADASGVQAAMALFLRFAELAPAER